MSGSPPREPTGATGPTDTRTPRLLVTGGGTPSDAELVALVVALAPSGTPPAEPPMPAWRRAALLEGAGGRDVLAPSDLALGSR